MPAPEPRDHAAVGRRRTCGRTTPPRSIVSAPWAVGQRRAGDDRVGDPPAVAAVEDRGQSSGRRRRRCGRRWRASRTRSSQRGNGRPAARSRGKRDRVVGRLGHGRGRRPCCRSWPPARPSARPGRRPALANVQQERTQQRRSARCRAHENAGARSARARGGGSGARAAPAALASARSAATARRCSRRRVCSSPEAATSRSTRSRRPGSSVPSARRARSRSIARRWRPRLAHRRLARRAGRGRAFVRERVREPLPGPVQPGRDRRLADSQRASRLAIGQPDDVDRDERLAERVGQLGDQLRTAARRRVRPRARSRSGPRCDRARRGAGRDAAAARRREAARSRCCAARAGDIRGPPRSAASGVSGARARTYPGRDPRRPRGSRIAPTLLGRDGRGGRRGDLGRAGGRAPRIEPAVRRRGVEPAVGRRNAGRPW